MICRSPRFYEKIWRWFKRRRWRSIRRGRRSSYGEPQFPTEKHSNLKHGCAVQDPRSKMPSVTSLSEPARTKLTSTASVVSVLAPPVRGDTIESGYHSNSPELASVASSKSRTYSGSNPRSPGIKLKVERFQFLKNKFHIEDSSLSEEIQESDTEFQINHDMNWLPKKSYRLSTSWNLRLRVIGGHSKADIILSMPCQKKQEIRNQESRHFW